MHGSHILKTVPFLIVGLLFTVLPARADVFAPSQGTVPAAGLSKTGGVVASPEMFGMHVPWALPLVYPIGDREYADWKGDWPTVPFGSLRLWDTRSYWSMIEREPGVFNWSQLDGHVALARQKNVDDVMLVLGGTPQWAAARPAPGSASWIGVDSAAVPDEAAWVNYVSTVVQRYKGRIKTYQIWNEPNSLLFWQGTPAELARLTHVAYHTIKQLDPGALVIAPGYATSERMSPNTSRRFWDAYRMVGFPFDVAAIHVYGSPSKGVEGFTSMVDRHRAIMREYGWQRSFWITEGSFLETQNRGSVPSPQMIRDLVGEVFLGARKSGAERFYWYAWGPKVGTHEPVFFMQHGTAAASGYDDAYRSLVKEIR